MAWFKVDDKLHDHRKARAAGCQAMGLWVLAGSWCGDNLTDGFVPDSIAARWDRNYRKLAARLVAVGLWVEIEQGGEAGWAFHDWHVTNPLRDKVLADREAAKERQRKARESRRDKWRDKQRESQNPDPTRPDPPPTEGRVGCEAPDCESGWVFIDKTTTVPCPTCNRGNVRQLRTEAS